MEEKEQEQRRETRIVVAENSRNNSSSNSSNSSSNNSSNSSSNNSSNSSNNNSSISSNSNSAELALECVICLSPMNEAFVITHLQCRQSFHSKCILQWMQVSPTCPVCRERVGEEFHPQQLSVVTQQGQDVCAYVASFIIFIVVVLLIAIHYY